MDRAYNNKEDFILLGTFRGIFIRFSIDIFLENLPQVYFLKSIKDKYIYYIKLNPQ